MEPLWSPVVATGGKRWQVPRPQTGRKQAQTVALGCDQLPRRAHGKEGVDGSSPSEGFAKAPQIWRFSSLVDLRDFQRAAGMEPIMELSGPEVGARADCRRSQPKAPSSRELDRASARSVPRNQQHRHITAGPARPCLRSDGSLRPPEVHHVSWKTSEAGPEDYGVQARRPRPVGARAAFRGRPQTRSFGATTAGATTSPNSYRLADGATIQFAVVLDIDRRGHIYRRAVRPDVFASILGGDDQAYRLAKRWLRSTTACNPHH
jgi:hypothetical protein